MVWIDHFWNSPRGYTLTMKKQYLHLSVHRCENCKGPVLAGSLAIRESEITEESDIRYVGAACLCCGNKQDLSTAPIRHLMPTEWDVNFRGGQSDRSEVAIDCHSATASQDHAIAGPQFAGD